MKNNLLNRFLKYTTFNSQSHQNSETTPSSHSQLIFSTFLEEELKNIGLSEVILDDKGYLTATLPSNCKSQRPTIGLIAHVDTSPDFSGENVKAIITPNYQGGDITLNQELGLTLSPSLSPELKNYVGQTIITTDGTTLLGADDKAGIAEIVTAMEILINTPSIEHGKIRICFTPDEEIGQGADFFNVEAFGADFAYTIDGGEIGELEYENFNAALATISINGLNIHPGYGYGRMINAQLVAHEFLTLLPNETPSNTKDYEGLFHLSNSYGDVERFELHILIRDFDETNFLQRQNTIKKIAHSINNKYPNDVVFVEIKEQYKNMRKMIEPHLHIVERAKLAMERVGVQPKIKPIRGGTDGARLSFMGLLCPNIFAGGHNFHGKYEYVPLESMEKAVETIIEIVKA